MLQDYQTLALVVSTALGGKSKKVDDFDPSLVPKTADEAIAAFKGVFENKHG